MKHTQVYAAQLINYSPNYELPIKTWFCFLSRWNSQTRPRYESYLYSEQKSLLYSYSKALCIIFINVYIYIYIEGPITDMSHNMWFRTKWHFDTHRIFKQLAKALIRLFICAGWSEALLVAQTTLLEMSCCGSYLYLYMCEWLFFIRF